jgi:hypothetical protein
MPLDEVRATIQDYYDKLAELFNEDNSAEFVRLALCGVYNSTQFVIDALDTRINRFYNDRHPLKVTRDVDSILGLSMEICITQQDLLMNVIPNFKYSIKKDIGLTCEVETPEVRLTMSPDSSNAHHAYLQGCKDVPIHHIPNYNLGHWLVRNELILVFPNAYNPENPSYKMPTERLHQFYDNAIRPAFIAALGRDRASNIAPSFDIAMFRARSKSGQLTYHSRLLNEDGLQTFAHALREAVANAEGLDWARDFVFLHKVQGIKDTYPHTTASATALDSLHHVLRKHHLIPDRVFDPLNVFYVDVAIELSSLAGYSLIWRTDSHANVLRTVFHIDDTNAERLTRIGSGQYVRDFALLFLALSGCRIVHGARGKGPFGIVKSQLYHTDKDLTAILPENGHYAKYVLVKDITQDKDTTTIPGLQKTFHAAASKCVQANARVEARIPVDKAGTFMTDETLQDTLWEDYVVAINPTTWW